MHLEYSRLQTKNTFPNNCPLCRHTTKPEKIWTELCYSAGPKKSFWDRLSGHAHRGCSSHVRRKSLKTYIFSRRYSGRNLFLDKEYIVTIDDPNPWKLVKFVLQRITECKCTLIQPIPMDWFKKRKAGTSRHSAPVCMRWSVEASKMWPATSL